MTATMLGGAIVTTTSAAMAQDADQADIKIAVVDINGILEQSEATKKIRTIIDEENQKFLASTEEEQLTLRTQEQELDSQKEILDEAEFNRRLKQFQDRVSLLQQKIQRQRREFDLSLQQANEQIRNLLFQIITDIAKENGYTLVMQKQNVILYDSSIDISKEALDRLN
ncbi:MAG: OmpH family outer membrane protein, partial [Alphaproteobacteria bacterium]|nr:OmpH family outer membrane protein [Alphaproteobacteria bacterium]